MKKKKRIIQINGVPVMAEEETVENEKANLTVYAGTTGLCGGGRSKGGRTYISLENTGAADMIVTLVKGKDGNGTGFEIAASGDDELVSIACAFATVTVALMDIIAKEDEE